jgi:hypothetical protein
MNEIALLIAATLNAGTVLAIAGLGLLINEKAGIVNLGAEGMMLVAAIAGFATACTPAATRWRFAAGGGAGALLAAVFGVLVIWLNTNQYATGLALSLFGAGFSAFVGIGYVQAKAGRARVSSPSRAGRHPVLGPALFRQHPMVYGMAGGGGCWPGSCTAPRPAWCCARWANRPSRPMRWATRCGASGWRRWWRRRAVRRGRGLPVDGVHAAVGGGHGGRQAAGSRWR